MEKALAPLEAILYVVGGIILSFVLPFAVKTLQRSKLENLERKLTLWERITNVWQKYEGRKYLGILVSAILVASALIFLLGLKFSTPRDAVLAGFAWESLINKLSGKSQSVEESP